MSAKQRRLGFSNHCILSLFSPGSFQGRVGDQCTQESDCDPGQCCQILHEFLVASKRQLVSVLQGPTRQGDSLHASVSTPPPPLQTAWNEVSELACAPGTRAVREECPGCGARRPVHTIGQEPGDPLSINTTMTKEACRIMSTVTSCS